VWSAGSVVSAWTVPVWVAAVTTLPPRSRAFANVTSKSSSRVKLKPFAKVSVAVRVVAL
jgi:hypothetical protein